MTDNNIYTIDDIKAAIKPIGREFGIKRMSLFGSYARGEAMANSDIDFHLIDPGGMWGYFKLCALRQALENCLGINVDVLTTGAIDKEVLETVQRDEVLVFEQ